MSCFVVDNKTINRFLTFFYFGNDCLHDTIKTKLAENKINTEDFIQLDKFGTKLLKMNIDAFEYRYDKKTIKRGLDSYKFEISECSIYQALKSLSCFLYQCSEENIPKRKLYKLLREIERNMELHIINGLPEYEKAEWN